MFHCVSRLSSFTDRKEVFVDWVSIAIPGLAFFVSSCINREDDKGTAAMTRLVIDGSCWPSQSYNRKAGTMQAAKAGSVRLLRGATRPSRCASDALFGIWPLKAGSLGASRPEAMVGESSLNREVNADRRPGNGGAFVKREWRIKNC